MLESFPDDKNNSNDTAENLKEKSTDPIRLEVETGRAAKDFYNEYDLLINVVEKINSLNLGEKISVTDLKLELKEDTSVVPQKMGLIKSVRTYGYQILLNNKPIANCHAEMQIAESEHARVSTWFLRHGDLRGGWTSIKTKG